MARKSSQASGKDMTLSNADPQGMRSGQSILRRDIVNNGRVPVATELIGWSEEKALKVKGTHFFMHHEVMPRPSKEAWRVMAQQVRNTIEDSDEMRQKWFFEKRYELDLTTGKDIFDLPSRIDALMFEGEGYFRAATPFIAHLATAISYLTLRGGHSFSDRISTNLKWSGLNTIFTNIGPIPFNSSLLKAIVNRTQLLKVTGDDGEEGISLPVFMDYGITDPLFNDLTRIKKDGSGTTDKVGINQVFRPKSTDTTDTTSLPAVGPVGVLNDALANNFALTYDELSDLTPATSVNVWWMRDAGGMERGRLVGALYNAIIRAREILKAEYMDTMLDPNSQLYRFFSTDSAAVIDCMVTIDSLANEVRALPLGDANDYAQKFKRYRSTMNVPSIPDPLLSQMDNGIVDRFKNEDGRITYVRDLSVDVSKYGSYLDSDLVRAVKLQKVLATAVTAAPPTVKPFMPMTDAIRRQFSVAGVTKPIMYTSDAEELIKLRSFTSTLRGTQQMVLTDLSTLVTNFTAIDWDWSKWIIVGYDPSYGADPYVVGDSLVIGELGKGKYSMMVEKGITAKAPDAFGKYLSFDSFPASGRAMVVLSYLEMISSSLIEFYKDSSEAIERYSNRGGDLGGLYLLAEELDMGMIIPREYNAPRVDCFSIYNCGFHRVTTIETVDLATENRQFDQWAYFARFGRGAQYEPVNGITLPGNVGQVKFAPFAAELAAGGHNSTGLDIADGILDDLLFVGDAGLISPLRHFMRTEIVPIPLRMKTSPGEDPIPSVILRFIGHEYPIMLFTFKRNDTPLSTVYASNIVGVGYNKSKKTVDALPAMTLGGDFDNIFNSVLVGDQAALDAVALSWKRLIPVLEWDTSRPRPFTVDNVLFSLLDQASDAVSASTYDALWAKGLEITPISSAVITQATQRLLKLAQDATAMKIPSIVDGKPKASKFEGPRSGVKREFKSFNKGSKGKSFAKKNFAVKDDTPISATSSTIDEIAVGKSKASRNPKKDLSKSEFSVDKDQKAMLTD